MRFDKIVLIAVSLLFLAGCSENHLILNKNYRETVERDFTDRKKLASERNDQLFGVFDKDLTISQSEALKFLFAYLPINDLADYNDEFFLANADIALKAREQSPWGSEIPEELFLHYVLPFRVNNENLDSFRIAYFDEISDRIKGLDIENAALEINHWCHEKVAYQPADIRTSAPMSTILSARGRCGEESTFTVSALRTAGIPARQVYTPRWAHTDDNHAWVEVWVNGDWHYMGACEPEPMLDRGWFTEPARRAMLVHTKSFGASYGNENLINTFKRYSEVNNLSEYAETKRIYVKVINSLNSPVKDALVEFLLYNYSEFYPLATIPANTSGICSFETGLGDLLVWARKGDDFNFKKISVAETDTLILKIDRKAAGNASENFDLNVPVLRVPFEGPEKRLVDENLERLNKENDIRQAYINSWIKPDEAEAFAEQIKTDIHKTKNILVKSMGNYKTITAFLGQTPENDRELALCMLEVIAEKDLRDIKLPVLNDHLKNYVNPFNLDKRNELFLNYVLNPRISNEMIVGWRSYFNTVLPAGLKAAALKDPRLITEFIDNNIVLNNEENYYKTPLTPKGVYELKLSDSWSRSICFVALCRSIGIPARLEPGSNTPQYFFESAWVDVNFADEKIPSGEKAFLKLVSSETNPVPEYYVHFTLARFENGRYNTLEYDYNRKVTDFKEELQLTPGHYMVVTGNRLTDGRILSNISFFDLAEGQRFTLEIKLRKDTSGPEKIGTIDLKAISSLLSGSGADSSDPDFDKGMVLIWLEPEKEPSKHILNDLPLLKGELDLWGGTFVFFRADSLQKGRIFNPKDYEGLPEKSLSVSDEHMSVMKSIKTMDPDFIITFPLTILTDNTGNILYLAAGYHIGNGEQILRNVQRSVSNAKNGPDS